MDLINRLKQYNIELVSMKLLEDNIIQFMFAKGNKAWLTQIPNELVNETNMTIMIEDAKERFSKESGLY